jgi:glycosyltransferase involved in cell wall biosynthesis
MIMKWRIPPSNIRVSNEVSTLAARGHDVDFLIEGRPGQPVEETVGGVHVVRGVIMGRLRETLTRHTFNFTYRDPLWRAAIDRAVGERGIEAIQVNDLPLMAEGVRAGRRHRLPVVADLHENYPAGLQVWYTSRLKRMTIYNYGRWSRYEKRILRQVDAIIVVIEEARDRLIGLGIPSEMIRVVPNTVSRESAGFPADPEILDRYRGLFVVSYIGGFTPHRGLGIVARSLPAMKRAIPNLRVVLVGYRAEPYRHTLEALVRELGCADIVEMVALQPQEKVWSFIDASAVCLVPHTRNPHTDTTIPNKIFQYMVRERAIVVSDCPPLARITRETGAGFVYKDDDPDALARAVIDLASDEAERRRMGEAGRRAIMEKYNWETTSAPLVELYDRLGRSARG